MTSATKTVHELVLTHITDPDNPLQGPDSEGQKR
jgi:hypothetical protein